MKGQPAVRAVARVRRIDASTRGRVEQSRRQATAVPPPHHYSGTKLNEETTEREPDPGQRRPALSGWSVALVPVGAIRWADQFFPFLPEDPPPIADDIFGSQSAGCTTCTMLFRTAYSTRSLTECRSNLRMMFER